MRKVIAWLGAATLMLVMSRAEAANDVLKPYVTLILDTSGSMLAPTGSGPTSCGKKDNRLNHAVCAIDNIVNSYGDMVFSFGRFRETTSGDFTSSCDANGDQEGNNRAAPTFPVPNGGDQCSTQGAYCGDCDTSTSTARACLHCTANNQCPSNYFCDTGYVGAKDMCYRPCTLNSQCTGGGSCVGGYCSNVCSGPDTCGTTNRCVGEGVCNNRDDQFEVLTGLVDGNNASTSLFVDGTCDTCDTTGGGNPEIWGVSSFTFTPLSASLRGAKRYWQGLQSADSATTIYPSTTDGTTNNPGFDPINRDPSNAVFLPGSAAATCNPNVSGPGVTCTPYVNGVCNAGANCCCASQCRPYITILLTDGDETCTSFTNTTSSATQLLTTTPRSDAITVSQVARANNVATITTPAVGLPHPFKVGDTVFVSGITAPTGFTGTYTVTGVPTPRSLTYANTGANVAATAPTGSATVRHVASFYRYQIQTIPIGFGIAPGDPDIEAIAHAGGAPDVPSVNEGYYAQDEADLELAISQILADSVRSELCNTRDDDCDVKVDEDFPTKGQTCTNGQAGACAATGTLVCRADGQGLQCNAPTVTPGNEGTVCNSIDDDCDGRIDEGLTCSSCVPTNETCNGADQDCDGVADQTCRCNGGTNAGRACNPNTAGSCPGGSCQCAVLTRPCGNGVCAGTETCINGSYQGCTAPASNPEQCNGLDDDCDGVCDGFSESCSTMGAACNNNSGSCPGSANPGSPQHLPAPIPENICRPGTRTCPLNNACNGNNAFGACSGEIKPCNGQTPCVDTCNGLDDDCDNKIDEDFLPADCSSNCGLGTTACVAGNIVCNGTTATGDPTCNNIDDDCDGTFDEDYDCDLDNDGQCDACGQGQLCNGRKACENGVEVCKGDVINPEVCNCIDDDCDGNVDEDPAPNDPNVNLCPGGATCVGGTACQCAFGCAEGEFPCPLGKKCETETMPAGNYCVTDVCFNSNCAANETCVPNPQDLGQPLCVATCTLINDTDNTQFPNCAFGQVCVDSLGECRPDTCETFPDRCTGAQSCINGTCITNPCQGIACDAPTYCLGGTCIASCSDVECPTGQRCREGACETDPCGHACPFGQACNDSTGQCIEDPCKFRDCPSGQWCNPNAGTCEDDPCEINDVHCPNANEVCRGGTCVDPSEDPTVDAGGEIHVTPGGGGCDAGGGDASLVFALGLAGLLLLRRRRTAIVAVGGLALASMQMSCNVNDYCINCAVDDGGGSGGGDGGSNDDGGVNDDGGSGTMDACTPNGVEVCDNVDNDCNGVTDDNIAEVGQPCDNQMGACAGGTITCNGGVRGCTKAASAEICDTVDNNCNGIIDEGDPGGGGKCGTEAGECVAGTLMCQASSGCDSSSTCNPLTSNNCCVKCINFIDHRSDAETCDAKDNDCDGNIDEGISSLGSCTWQGATNNGECNIGTLMCQGGNPVCTGAVFPKFESCNSLDDDCDTNVDEIFNKNTDPTNCGTCGNVCGAKSKTCVAGANAKQACTNDSDCPGSTCATNSQPCCGPSCAPTFPSNPNGNCSYKCNVGFVNLDGLAANGCEYKCSPTGAEECDGADNDCDGKTDEGVSAPAGLCLTFGVCAGSTAQCSGAQGWTCSYPTTAEFPEVSCDNLDNDCDQNVDDAPLHQAKGQTCDDGQVGVCRDTGTLACNTADPDGPLTCQRSGETGTQCTNATDDNGDGKINDGCPTVGPPETGASCANAIDDDNDGRINDGCPQSTLQNTTAGTENCNAKDDDCDGNVDEGATLAGRDWVDVGGGKQMMKYEASRPDATGSDVGINNTTVCSRAGSLPWVNVTYRQALLACQSVGATLCDEEQWHRACSVVAPTTWPLSAPTGATTFIEAEDYFAIGYAPGVAEGACTGSADDDGDGRINDGCPVVATFAETNCTDNVDNDGDGRINDGCPAISANMKAWVEDYTGAFSGIAAMEATPNTASGSVARTSAAANAPRLDYRVTLAAATYHVWVKLFQTSSTTSDSVHVGITSAVAPQTPAVTVAAPAPLGCTSDANCSTRPGTTCQDTDGSGVVDTCVGWVWADAGTFVIGGAATYTLEVFMAEDGTKLDKIAINQSTTAPADSIASTGGTWAYATNPNTYQSTTCNGADLSAANDNVLATGTLTSCFANGSGANDAYDMSGNVKEWTLAHLPGENPIRGGASNNTGGGLSCALNFTLADDSFFFPNIGFRCCK